MGGGAVETFFVLSGFLSGYFYNEKTSLSLANCFYSLKKKTMASWPLYMIMLLVSVYYRKDGLFNFVKCIFLIQSYFGDSATALSFNWVSWFLSSILLSYFLAPVLNKLCKKVESKSLLVMIILFIFQIIFAFGWKNKAEPYSLGYYYIYIFPPVRMIDYALGILTARLFKMWEDNKKPILINEEIINIIETVIVVFYIGELTVCHLIPYSFKYVLIWVPISIVLVWMFALQGGRVSQYLTCPFLLWIGSMSFELYLIHRMVLLFFADISKDMWAFVFAFITTILLACIVCDSKLLVKKVK